MNIIEDVQRQGLFHIRNFKLLFTGKIISQLGDQIYIFSMGWYILTLTRSSLEMALFLVIENIVLAACSPLGGMIADRVSRKSLMVWMDIARMVIVLAVAMLFTQSMLHLWMIYLSAALLGICGSVFSPSASAIIPDIVKPDLLVQAMSANQFSTSLCTVLGMLTGGILYNSIGITAIFICNAASYLVSAMCEVFRYVEKENKEKDKIYFREKLEDYWCGIREGLKYIKTEKIIIRLLTVNTVINFIAIPIVLVYMPYFFNVFMPALPVQLSVSQAAIWIGIIAGSFIVPGIRNKELKYFIVKGLFIMGLCAFPGILLFFPGITNALGNWGFCVLWSLTGLFSGFSSSLFMIPMYTFFQQRIHPNLRGRFWGIEGSLRTLATCGGYLFAGLVTQFLHLGVIFTFIAFVFLAIMAWAIRQKTFSIQNDYPIEAPLV